MAKKFYTKAEMLENIVETPNRKSFTNLENMQIGRLTVLKWAGITMKRNYWWCKCDCDSQKFFKVMSTSLQKGLTTSCGCNYRHNGGHKTKIPEKIEAAWEVLHYKGLNHFATVRCRDCLRECKEKGYTLIQIEGCDCKRQSKSLYIFKDILNTNIWKVGVTEDVSRRIKDFRGGDNPHIFEVYYTKELPASVALLLETAIHKDLTTYRANLGRYLGSTEVCRFNNPEFIINQLETLKI